MEENVQETKAESAPEGEPKEEARRLVVGVRFRRAGNIYTFVTDDSTLTKGDRVVVEAEGGRSFGWVASAPEEMEERKLPANAKRLLRKFNEGDTAEASAQRERALECFEIGREKIESKDLPMKLIDVEVSEGGRKATFVFFAEQRVDFRSLVKDLAGLLRMRIEMHQVGARDESKLIGCMGPCGLTTCCSTHLKQFRSISISMAKRQGLAPNPAKLTGMCGKLKCCLSYESAVYDECRKGLPKSGAAVKSPDGNGKIIGHNVLKRECTVKLYGGGQTRVPCDQCRVLSPDERDAAITAARQSREEDEERRQQRRSRRDRKNRNVKGRDKRHGKEGK